MAYCKEWTGCCVLSWFCFTLAQMGTLFHHKHKKDADQTVHLQLFRIIAVYSVIVIIFSTSYILNFKLLVIPCSAVV